MPPIRSELSDMPTW